MKPESVALGSLSVVQTHTTLVERDKSKLLVRTFSEISGVRNDKLIDMPFKSMAIKYERTVKAADQLRYMMTEEHDANEEALANLGKNWQLIISREHDEYMGWMRQKICRPCVHRVARWRQMCPCMAVIPSRALGVTVSRGRAHHPHSVILFVDVGLLSAIPTAAVPTLVGLNRAPDFLARVINTLFL